MQKVSIPQRLKKIQVSEVSQSISKLKLMKLAFPILALLVIGGVIFIAEQPIANATSTQNITSNDIGFNPPNLCQSRHPINPNPRNGPTGPLGKALSGAQFNNASDGSDVYCKTAPPKNPYYQDTKDHHYKRGNDHLNAFKIAGQLTKSSFDQFCQTSLGVSGGPKGGGAHRDGNNVYSWQCHRQSGDAGIPIEVNNVCHHQFGAQAARSRLNYYWSGNPQMWECLSQAENLGDINLDQYCRDVKDRNGNILYSKSMWGSTAYDGFCQAKDSKSDQSGTGGNSVKFDTMLDVCQWQYPQYQYIIDILITYQDRTSWKCWGNKDSLVLPTLQAPTPQAPTPQAPTPQAPNNKVNVL